MRKFFIEDFVDVLLDVLISENSFKRIGIFTNEDDCIYICKTQEKYNIEYKSSNKEQFDNISILKHFAVYKNFKYSITQHNSFKACFFINCNYDIKGLIELLLEMEFDVFGNRVQKTEFNLLIEK